MTFSGSMRQMSQMRTRFHGLGIVIDPSLTVFSPYATDVAQGLGRVSKSIDRRVDSDNGDGSDSPRSCRSPLHMTRTVLLLAAWVEMIAGIALLIAPKLGVSLLLGAEVGAAGLVMVRFAGVGILSLGIACLPGRQHSALLFFNAGVAALLALAGLTSSLGGSLLWPFVMLHAGFALALGRALLPSRAAN
jgi:hypothetical protein